MFITGLNRYTKSYNKNILDYCMKSTQDSIKRMVEKNILEKEKEKKFVKFNLYNNDDDDDNNNNNNKFNFTYYNLIIFLSISSIGIYFYKKLK